MYTEHKNVDVEITITTQKQNLYVNINKRYRIFNSLITLNKNCMTTTVFWR